MGLAEHARESRATCGGDSTISQFRDRRRRFHGVPLSCKEGQKLAAVGEINAARPPDTHLLPASRNRSADDDVDKQARNGEPVNMVTVGLGHPRQEQHLIYLNARRWRRDEGDEYARPRRERVSLAVEQKRASEFAIFAKLNPFEFATDVRPPNDAQREAKEACAVQTG